MYIRAHIIRTVFAYPIATGGNSSIHFTKPRPAIYKSFFNIKYSIYSKHINCKQYEYVTECAQRLDQAFLLADNRFYEKSYVSVFFICFTDP